MKVKTAIFTPYGPPIVVALVESNYTVCGPGDELLGQLSRHFPTDPIMLVSIEPNGFRAYATFQTGRLLALLQLEYLTFETVNLCVPPRHPEQTLPF